MFEGNISAAFPYVSRFIEIEGSKMHYIESGQGDPVLFLHGMPASSYLWRNIIPMLSNNARCIAIDMIGMGKSAKPNIEYRVFDHIHYVNELIKTLKLKNITLVLHGWGSVIGFDYAMRHPENVKAIAFYEAHILPVTDWHALSLPVQQLATLLTSDYAEKAIVERNYLIDKILPKAVLRKLTNEEYDNYRAPFLLEKDRKVLWQYIKDLPLGYGGPKDVIALMEQYSNALQQSLVPKFMLYGMPGFITTIATVKWVKDHLPNVSFGDLHESLHFAQESQPKLFGQLLRDWYLQLN